MRESTMMRRLWWVVVMIAHSASGCDFLLGTKLNPKYCAAHPEDADCQAAYPDAALDGTGTCSSSAECSAPTAVCDLAAMTCVECTAAEDHACTGSTPVCGGDHMCRACATHDECGSAACLAGGACAREDEVAYVDAAGTDNDGCTRALPCTNIAKALATSRPYVKLTGTIDAGTTVTITDRNVTLLAGPGAKLTRTNNGLLLEIEGDSQVSIYDLEIGGASGAQGIGVSIPPGSTAEVKLHGVKVTGNQAMGVSASGGRLALTHSSIFGNTGGGVSVSNAEFVIVGNMFYQNGTQGSLAGAVVISAPANGANRLEFNSFNQNASTNGVAPAIQCTVAGTFTARNNIMSENGTLTNMNQVGGTCLHAYSIVRPGIVPAGPGNISADPLFVNANTGDLHIQDGSPARDAADPASDLTGPAAFDLDGDPRMSPADMGADELR